jgi:hypothetical protein
MYLIFYLVIYLGCKCLKWLAPSSHHLDLLRLSLVCPSLTRACLGEELVVCEYAEIGNHKIDPIGF